MTTNITSAALSQFYGSEEWYFNRLFRNINYTQGVKYLSDNGAAWLITDILSVLSSEKKVKAEEFVCIILEVDVEKHTGVMTITDGDEKKVYERKYEYTDFPLPLMKFFAVDKRLMLTSEY